MLFRSVVVAPDTPVPVVPVALLLVSPIAVVPPEVSEPVVVFPALLLVVVVLPPQLESMLIANATTNNRETLLFTKIFILNSPHKIIFVNLLSPKFLCL